MQKIGDSTSTANGAGEYTQGQPGSGIDATMITAAWLNAVQREIVNVIAGAGITLNPADDSQLLKSIQAIQAAANTWAKLTGKPTTVSGFGITDAFTKTEVSTAIQQAVASLVASSPAALDTLKELADALGGDPNFATTMTNALAGKASIASIQSQGATAFTTGGAASALTLTPSPAITAYAANQRFRVKFNVASTGADTLNISTKGAKSLKQYSMFGVKIPAVFMAGQLSDVEYDGIDFVLLNPLPISTTTQAELWALQPIGVPIPVFTHLSAVLEPPTNQSYRYIKLSAADPYNDGVLIAEVVSGSAPLVQASGLISLAGSPLNNQRINLINTERRSIRAGSVGTVEDDQFQGFGLATRGTNLPTTSVEPLQSPNNTGIGGNSVAADPGVVYRATVRNGAYPLLGDDGANGTPRIGNETRTKNIGVTYYLRIK
ncbi:hypothetical protein [Pseudomonas sp. G2-4]|uniref:hypothetical protein n=1 Tax=Pseudomonas sp. G2-4 TaxID=1506334 RepID=UPI0024B88DC6|nr:hypothetical protein [Pseudomonas sp. G2-4]WHS58611.1 hypothetical protein QNH97_19365 [Pseudomonas sp. G2-4]